MNRQQGLTLVEIIVALVILSVIAGLMLRTYASSQRTGFNTASANCLTVINAKQALHYARTGTYAGSITQLGSDTTDACTNKDVRVTPYQPAPNSANTSQVSVSGANYTVFAWHPNGNVIFYTYTAGGVPFGKINF